MSFNKKALATTVGTISVSISTLCIGSSLEAHIDVLLRTHYRANGSVEVHITDCIPFTVIDILRAKYEKDNWLVTYLYDYRYNKHILGFS